MASETASGSIEHQAKRLRELFRNRFSQKLAEKLVSEFDGEGPALDFLLNENENDVRRFMQTTQDYLEDLRRDSQGLASILANGIPSSVRMFGCSDCNRTWWQKVPQRKEVSKCHRCNVKYDPIPKDKEWGWGKFLCSCGHEFLGFAEMGQTESVCYECKLPVPVNEICPPRKNSRRHKKTKIPHSCNGVNCYNRDLGNTGDHAEHPSHMADLSQALDHSHGHYTDQDTDQLGVGMSEMSLAGHAGSRSHSQSNNTKVAPGAYPTIPAPVPICTHPLSHNPEPTKKKKMRWQSSRHRSTGSTVSDVMSQGSIDNATVMENAFLEGIREEIDF